MTSTFRVTGSGKPGGDAVLEDLPGGEAVRERLAESGATIGEPAGWSAEVELEGTTLWLRGNEDAWSIFAPPETDPADAMDAARKLHALLGSQSEGWDLDR